MQLQAVNAGSPSQASPANATDALAAGDFLQLMITQLTHQDPLKPTDNQALLDQLSSIRQIQQSTTLTETLQSLTGQQRYSSAASLIGRNVSGVSVDDTLGTQTVSGRVSSVSFDEAGAALLHLDDGSTLPISGLRSVTDANATAESLLGRMVRGRDQTGSDPSQLIEGIVTGFRREDNGRTTLELDTGEELSMSDVTAVV